MLLVQAEVVGVGAEIAAGEHVGGEGLPGVMLQGVQIDLFDPGRVGHLRQRLAAALPLPSELVPDRRHPITPARTAGFRRDRHAADRWQRSAVHVQRKPHAPWEIAGLDPAASAVP